MKKSKYLLILLVLSGVSACKSVPKAEHAAIIDIDFAWSKKSGCSQISPAIKVSNVPKNTSYLKFKMSDWDAPNFNHGGGEVAYAGNNLIPEGALKSYTGPCPPSGKHTYEITVKALNASKEQILGEGKNHKKYPE